MRLGTMGRSIQTTTLRGCILRKGSWVGNGARPAAEPGMWLGHVVLDSKVIYHWRCLSSRRKASIDNEDAECGQAGQLYRRWIRRRSSPM